MVTTLDPTVMHYLRDVHSIEEQALVQLRRAPSIAGDEVLGQVFREHLEETGAQERRVRDRLTERGADPSRTKDIAGQAGGYGMLLFARSQPDTPGKLTAHAFSYEHLELAAYELLALAAERAGDQETAALARAIRDEESAMGARLAENFDLAVAASLRELSARDLPDQLVGYLADAHAIESQALQLLDIPRSTATRRSVRSSASIWRRPVNIRRRYALASRRTTPSHRASRTPCFGSAH